MEIATNVHQVPGTMANTYLIVDDDGLTLVDTGITGSESKILAYVAELAKSGRAIKRILLTHSDGDHTGGLAALVAVSGARVFASPVEAEAIRAGRASRPLKGNGIARILFALASRFFRSAPARVDEYLYDGQVLPVLGGLQVMDTQGHTPGHISFYAPGARILFTGDSITSRGKTLKGSSGGNTWDQRHADAAVRKQAALGATIICPGHGAVVKDASREMVRLVNALSRRGD